MNTKAILSDHLRAMVSDGRHLGVNDRTIDLDALEAAVNQILRLEWLEAAFSQLKTSASERVMDDLGLTGDPGEPLADLVDRAASNSYAARLPAGASTRVERTDSCEPEEEADARKLRSALDVLQTQRAYMRDGSKFGKAIDTVVAALSQRHAATVQPQGLFLDIPPFLRRDATPADSITPTGIDARQPDGDGGRYWTATEEWPQGRETERGGDMGEGLKLQLFREADGDIIVSVLPEKHKFAIDGGVQFCSPGTGGGRSRHTHAALVRLMVAMEKDSAARQEPQG